MDRLKEANMSSLDQRNRDFAADNYDGRKVAHVDNLKDEKAKEKLKENNKRVEQLSQQIKEGKEESLQGDKDNKDSQTKTTGGFDQKKFELYYEKYESELESHKPKGRWDRIKRWWKGPDQGLFRSFVDFADAVFVSNTNRYNRFASVIEDSTSEDSSPHELAVALATIERFWKDHGYDASEYGFTRLLREHKWLTKKLIEHSESGEVKNNTKKLAQVRAGFVVENGRQMLKVWFEATNSEQNVEYSGRHMENQVDRVMDKYRFWRGKKKKKFSHSRFDTTKPRWTDLEKMLFTATSILGLASAFVWASDKKPEENKVSWLKSKRVISAPVNVAQSHLAHSQKRVGVYWQRIVDLARERGIDVNQHVKKFMTDDFAAWMADMENESLVLNNTDLIPGNYNTFDQFKLVCAFRAMHRDYFAGNRKHKNLMIKYPDLVMGVETIGGFLCRLQILRLGREPMQDRLLARSQKQSFGNTSRVKYVNSSSPGNVITKIDHSNTPLPGRQLTMEQICQLIANSKIDISVSDPDQPPEMLPPIPGVEIPQTIPGWPEPVVNLEIMKSLDLPLEKPIVENVLTENTEVSILPRQSLDYENNLVEEERLQERWKNNSDEQISPDLRIDRSDLTSVSPVVTQAPSAPILIRSNNSSTRYQECEK